jgi:hypothetical protein
MTLDDQANVPVRDDDAVGSFALTRKFGSWQLLIK